MKRILTTALFLGLAIGALSLNAFAADKTTPDKGKVSYTEGTEKYTAEYDVSGDLINGNQYLLLVVQDDANADADLSAELGDTEEKIMYIDQQEAKEGKVSFEFIPKSLRQSNVYLTGEFSTTADSYVRLGSINVDGVQFEGTIASWDEKDNVEFVLYEKNKAPDDKEIRAAWQKNDNSHLDSTWGYVSSADVIKDTIVEKTVDGKTMQTQKFTITAPAGDYKLAIFKVGQYVPKIIEVSSDAPEIAGTIKLWKYGDVTGEGKVTTADAGQIQRYALTLTPNTLQKGDADDADKVLAADVNLDGKVTTADAGQVQRKSLTLTPNQIDRNFR